MPAAVPSDPGLQAERTALAWSRTALAVLVNALLVLRSGLQHGSKPISALGVALLGAAAAVAVYTAYRKRHLTMSAPSTPAPAAMMVTSAIAVLVCVAALVLIGVSQGRGITRLPGASGKGATGGIQLELNGLLAAAEDGQVATTKVSSGSVWHIRSARRRSPSFAVWSIPPVRDEGDKHSTSASTEPLAHARGAALESSRYAFRSCAAPSFP